MALMHERLARRLRRHTLTPAERGCLIGGGGSPPAPDPAVQTAAEAAANRFNINSPFGTVNWQQSPKTVIGYDQNGNPVYGTKYTANVALNPQEQAQYNTHAQIAQTMLDQANATATGGAPEYSSPQTLPALPSAQAAPGAQAPYSPAPLPTFDNGTYEAPSLPQSDLGSFQPGPLPTFENQPFSLGAPQAQSMPDSMGTFDLNSASSPAANAHYQRIAEQLQPSFDEQTRAFDQKMANAGIPVGSEAYDTAMRDMLNEQNGQLSQAAYESAEIAPQLALEERQQQQAEQAQGFGQGSTIFGEQLAGGNQSLAGRQQQLAEQEQAFQQALAGGDQSLQAYEANLGAQGQQFNQALAGAQESLAARQQNLGEQQQAFEQALAGGQQSLTARQLADAEQAQAFGEGQTGFNEGLQLRQQVAGENQQQAAEDLAHRQEYYNEIAQALGTEQLNPLQINGQPLNVAGAFGQANQSALAGYNADQAQSAQERQLAMMALMAMFA